MDLNAPLGLNKPPKSGAKSKARRVAPLAIGATIATVLAIGLAVLFTRADPHGGEPYAVALVPPPPPPKAAPPIAPDPMPTGSIANPTRPDSVSVENGVKVISPGAPEATRPDQTGPLVIDVSKALDERARKVASRDQPTRPGALPSVTTGAPKPRIAIVVGGIGLSESATRTAIELMPPAVSLAFVPNGNDLSSSLATAKAKGHEILLQLPMQNTQGGIIAPHALRAGEPTAELTRDLTWLSGRFDGYVGVANLLGAPVTADRTVMTTVLRTVGQRSLFYLDDGTSRRSIASSLGPDLGVPTAQADVVLDATGDPAVVQANLEKLVTLARTKGSAIGMASGLTDHLAAVARFATALDARGFALVPVSSIARGGESFAKAR